MVDVKKTDTCRKTTQTFRARNMQEALAQIRREVGSDAVIVGKRPVPTLDAREAIEVTVRIDEGTTQEAATRSHDELKRLTHSFRERARRSLGSETSDASDVAQDTPSWLEQRWSQERGGLNQHRYQQYCSETLQRLVDRDVDRILAQKWVDALRQESGDSMDTARLRSQLVDMVTNHIQAKPPVPSDSSVQKIVAMVGPTGVGKTSVIAKLATHHRLVKQQSVGVIAVGMCELGVPELLQRYCEIIDVPLATVETSADMRKTLNSMAGKSLVLVDTAGHGYQDEVRHQHLRQVLSDTGTKEVHLVLSCVANRHALRDAVVRFSDVEPNAVLLTKLDEASRLGHLVSVLGEAKLPVSYVTRGQRIPQDLEPADTRKLANDVLA